MSKKPLMSEMLDDTRRYLEQAEKTDVSGLTRTPADCYWSGRFHSSCRVRSPAL